MGRSVKRYQNAATILPKPLLMEVQRLAAGKVLYIPYPVTRREFNRLKVLDLRMQGYSISQIAFRVGITQRGVCKILQNDRERAFTTLRYVGWGGDADEGEDVDNREPGEKPPSRQNASLESQEGQ
ncbi:MAG TPA: helix-turn-helix domain-containing protein [Armatimonadota bacterium]